MTRIFPLFAALAILLLAANFATGLWIGDFNAAARTKRTALEQLRGAQLRPGTTSAALEAAEQQTKQADEALAAPRSRMTIHMLLGCSAALVAILVNSVAITYFIGTARWCKEVVDAYALPQLLAQQMAALKRRTFRWSLIGIVTMIAVAGLGAAADPSGANFRNSAALVLPHYLSAMAAIALIAFSYWMQWQVIEENNVLLAEVMSGVRTARAARGLPTN